MTLGVPFGTTLKNSTMDIKDWHTRYLQQAGWTQSARSYLLNKINPLPGSTALEIGCGTAAVASEIRSMRNIQLYGIDIDRPALKFASSFDPTIGLTQADGYHLPFSDNLFTFSFCHYLLLWINNPVAVLEEMKRVTIPGGYVAIMAEPDYGGSVCFPDALDEITRLQTASLIKQGANPLTGRMISVYLHQAGLHDHIFSVLGGEWEGSKNSGVEDASINDAVVKHDLEILMGNDITKTMSKISLQGRVQFIPTFFALANKTD